MLSLSRACALSLSSLEQLSLSSPHVATDEERKNLFQQAMQYKGMDVTSLITVPVWIFEPTTFLIRQCEVTAQESFLRKVDSAAFNGDLDAFTRRIPLDGFALQYVFPRF